MARRLATISLTILLVSFLFMMTTPLGRAQPPLPAKVYVDPPKIENEALVPNTTFNVSVKVDDIPPVPGICGIQFLLAWNSSVLNAVNMQELLFHEVMPVDELDNLWRLTHKAGVGSAEYAYAFLDNQRAITNGYAPINGSHTIANITLKVVGFGKCALTIDPANTILGDKDGNSIPINIFDGFFSNLPPPPAPKAASLYVDPAKIVNSSLTPSNNFTVNINIVNASALSGLEFKLGFNATALHANSVTRGSFIPPSVTPVTQIDNATGLVRFNVSLSSPLDGDGTVAVIQFHVEADKVRNSTLHLYDVKLVNSTGQDLQFTTADGSFTNAKTIVGDLNQSGKVDLQDAILASLSFGHSLGEKDYNPDADLNEDNTMNIFDIILLANNFGKSA